jgi:glycerol uptake facilitator-like aquaporin
MGTVTKKDREALLAEFVGMTMFVYTGVGAAHMAVRNSSHGTGSAVLTISLAFGLAITAFAYGTAGFSGGHLNPAVTTSLILLGEIKVKLGGLYIVAQCLGATIGSILAGLADPFTLGFALNVVNPYTCSGVGLAQQDIKDCVASHFEKGSDDACQNNLFSGSAYVGASAVAACGEANRMWGPAIVVEAIGTFMLVMTVCWTAVSKKSIADNCAPLAIGLSVFFAHLTAIPITNCSINPARSFGAALANSMGMTYRGVDDKTTPRASEAWEHMIFFWVVPMVGGALAALTFKHGFQENAPGKGGAAVADEAAAAAEAKDADPKPDSADAANAHDQVHGTHAQSMGGAVFRRYSMAPSTLRGGQVERRRIPTAESKV